MYKSFRNMSVWQKAINLSEKVFRLTVSLPKSEDYGITSQIRQSANSVSANIAEGFGRNTNKDKRNFYIIARGSAFETQSHLLYGNKIKYFKSKVIGELISEYDSLIFELNKIMKSLKV
jgi:four helix bundle protein